jgi:hypothetical protein
MILVSEIVPLIVDFPLKTSKEIKNLQQTRELKVNSMIRRTLNR